MNISLRNVIESDLAILLENQVVRSLGSWEQDGRRELCYWIDRKRWGFSLTKFWCALFMPEQRRTTLHQFEF